jgi:hypothetical protein
MKANVIPLATANDLLGMRAGDENLVRAPLDFIGLNYYTPWIVRDAPQGNGVPGLNTDSVWAEMHGAHPKTDIGWAISNGPRASRNASAWSMSITTTVRNARSRIPDAGTHKWRRRTAWCDMRMLGRNGTKLRRIGVFLHLSLGRGHTQCG